MTDNRTKKKGREIAAAAEALRQGRVVAFPTETVYGLGADATNARAVRRIYEIKGRPSHNPLICHVTDAATARRFAATWPEAAQRLAERFWPGPLTLVLPKAAAISDEATAGGPTVGLRAPDHPLALELLRRFGGPVAAPSANLSNRISPTTADHVRQQLGDRVSIILDGGPCRVGIESTVLNLSTDRPRILRPGGVSRAAIETIIGPVEMESDSNAPASLQAPLSSPGRLPVHYAPRRPAYRFTTDQRSEVMMQAKADDALVQIGSPGSLRSSNVHWMPDDPILYAHRLYALLVELDQPDTQALYIEMPPDTPPWTAIRDRLKRATRPWSEKVDGGSA